MTSSSAGLKTLAIDVCGPAAPGYYYSAGLMALCCRSSSSSRAREATQDVGHAVVHAYRGGSVRSLPSSGAPVAGRPGEQPAPVGERHIAAVGSKGAVNRLIPLDEHLGPRDHALSRPATSHERTWGTGLDHPALDGPVFPLDIDVHPRVRIDPLHPRDRARQPDRSVRIELCRERVVCLNRRAGQEKDRDRFRPPPSLSSCALLLPSLVAA